MFHIYFFNVYKFLEGSSVRDSLHYGYPNRKDFYVCIAITVLNWRLTSVDFTKKYEMKSVTGYF